MKRLDGVNSLLVTPFTETNEFDERSMRRLVDRAVEDGVHSVIALGRVGEVMYLTMEEREKAITTVVDQVAGRVPVGCGWIDLTFEDGLELGRIARRAGADFIMSRASVDGDPIEYYRRLAEIIPVMV